MKSFVKIVLILTIISVSSTFCGFNARSNCINSSLKGISGVYIVFEDLSPTLKEARLNADELKKEIYTAFKNQRIGTYSDYSNKKPDAGVLTFSLKAAEKGGVIAASLRADLKQHTLLARPGGIEGIAITWTYHDTGFFESHSAAVDIKNFVMKAADQFRIDYRKVNR
ncbi:MAG: hypothetical protein ACLFQK_03565 [Fibrobacterota bacterium]